MPVRSCSPARSRCSTPTATSIGFTMNSKRFSTTGFALEVWTGSPAAMPATRTLLVQRDLAGYFVLPNIQGGVLGDFTIENAAITFGVTGGSTKDGNTWGVGPYTGAQRWTRRHPVDVGSHLDQRARQQRPPRHRLDHGGLPGRLGRLRSPPRLATGCRSLLRTSQCPALPPPAPRSSRFDNQTAGTVDVTIARNTKEDGTAAATADEAVFPTSGPVTVYWANKTDTTKHGRSPSAAPPPR